MRSLLLSAALIAGAAGSAEAASGAVYGKVLFYQHNNDYCPSTQDCTAANYVESQYNTYQPLANAKVYMEDQAGAVVAQGAVAPDGYFVLTWYSPSTPTSARIYVRMYHKDDRFRFYTAAGSSLRIQFSSFVPINGTTTNGTAQHLGTYTIGSATSPSAYANAFDGAQRMWNDALRYSSDMIDNFTDVKILAFGNDDECPTSCASGKTIKLDSNATYDLSSRILHEMGHVVSSTAKPWDSDATYCYSTPELDPSTCGWSMKSQEWRSRSFEEGIATFFGDVTLYWYWANDPIINGLSREVNGSCSDGESRWALSALRYIWDVYDSHVDSGWEDDAVYGYDAIVETLQKFCDGTGDHYASEAKVNFDGRSSSDFAYNLVLAGGNTTAGERTNNCVD